MHKMPEELVYLTALSGNIVLAPSALEEIDIQGWHIWHCFSALAKRRLQFYTQHLSGGEGS